MQRIPKHTRFTTAILLKPAAILFLLYFMAGCRHKEGIPGDIIAREQMQSILWDLIQADQFSVQYLAKDSARKNVRKETIQLYGEVFQLHNVSKEEFQKSFQYYLTRPDLTKRMLDTLSERARRQRALGNQKPLPPSPMKPR